MEDWTELQETTSWRHGAGAAADAGARHSNDNNDDNNNGHNGKLHFASRRSACSMSIVRSISEFSFNGDQELVDTRSGMMSWEKKVPRAK